jgi:hypothetical protein
MFAAEFEAESGISLAIAANLLRVLGEPTRLRDLPALTGISREAVAMGLGVIEKRRLAVTGPDPSSRGSVIRLTAHGTTCRRRSLDLIDEVEARWTGRYAQELVNLRSALDELTGDDGEVTLLAGMVPYPDGWRARVPSPTVLPWFPTVLHRGGYPDGS